MRGSRVRESQKLTKHIPHLGGTVCLIPAAFLGFCTVPGTEQVLDK